MSLITEGKLFNTANSESGGGGAVASVNGKTGTVVLDATDVNALPDSTKYVANASWTIDSSSYVMTLQLKDQDGANIGTAQTIDLPLESVVVGGSYDNTNKKIVLTLNNGTTIDIPVADLVSGLQSEITVQAPLSADLVDDTNTTHKFVSAAEKSTWNGKQDAINDLATIRSGAAAGATAVQPGDLATVATTGDYDDLTNKPTIPAAQVNSDWSASSGVAQILNKPTLGTMAAESAGDYTKTANLATVATTGAYSDLSGAPTIPTVNNATLTITQGGTTKGTFTANAGTDVIIDVDAGGSSLPDQTGNAGKFLITDGTNASWGQTIIQDSTHTMTITGKELNFGNGTSTYGRGWIWFPFENHCQIKAGSQYNFTAYHFSTSDSQTTLGESGNRWANVYTRKINNGFDISVPYQAGTMVVADYTGATAGQVLTLDSNGNAVWQAGGGGATSATATLAVADWSNNSQTVNVTGVTASNNVIVSPAPASQSDYTTAGILCTAQGAGTLTFTCTTTPSSAITVNVLII